MKFRYTFLAFLAAFGTVLVMIFLFTMLEVVLFKPHELGALLGTAFAYGRLILVIWIARLVYKKVRSAGTPKPETVPSETVSPLELAIDKCDE